jgi:hypothetical protein
MNISVCYILSKLKGADVPQADVPVGNQNMPFAQTLLLMSLDVPLAQEKKNGI